MPRTTRTTGIPIWVVVSGVAAVAVLAFLLGVMATLLVTSRPDPPKGPLAKGQAPGAPAAPPGPAPAPEPAPKTPLQLAIEKLAEFARADEVKQAPLANELETMCATLPDADCLPVIEAIENLKGQAKPLAGILCRMLGGRPEPQRKKALQALEVIRPDLYDPLVVLTVNRYTAKDFAANAAINKLATSRDPAVAPFLLQRINEGIRAALESRRFDFPSSRFVAYMETLVAVAPDDPATLKAISSVADAFAFHREARNFRSDNTPVARSAVLLLGSFGPKAKDAIPILRELKLSEEPSVRDAAVGSLRKIEGQ